jgi:hypothetical protein
VYNNAQFDPLSEFGQSQQTSERLIEGPPGLHNVIVHPRLGAVNWDADHLIRVIDGSVVMRKDRIAKAATVRQQVDGGARNEVPAQAEHAQQSVAVEGWLSPREVDVRGVVREKTHQLTCLIEEPVVIPSLGRL